MARVYRIVTLTLVWLVIGDVMVGVLASPVAGSLEEEAVLTEHGHRRKRIARLPPFFRKVCPCKRFAKRLQRIEHRLEKITGKSMVKLERKLKRRRQLVNEKRRKCLQRNKSVCVKKN